MEFIVIGDKPKAHKGKRITIGAYVKTETETFIEWHVKEHVLFSKENGYQSRYYVTITEKKGEYVEMVLLPYDSRGNRIKLQVTPL